MKRREFIRSTAVLLAVAAVSAASPSRAGTSKPQVASYRRIGRTDMRMSDISCGTGQLPSASLVLRAVEPGNQLLRHRPGLRSQRALHRRGPGASQAQRRGLHCLQVLRAHSLRGGDEPPAARPKQEKVGASAFERPAKLRTAFYDHGRCLPWAMHRECIVCEEMCPASPKAIWYKTVEVTGRDGSTRTLKQPCVDPGLCIGCGICENRCPVEDLAAIRVSSVGETRSESNQMILER